MAAALYDFIIAEKSADLILGNQPLPPVDVEFYWHRPGHRRQRAPFEIIYKNWP
ncbi:MAG TPA: hypothetical protein VE733_26415 [Streptosporangiaceae bacterium]|jgi:hypothetical protein|nr:hypothetical protein [Streptosporangiaceae bacterium]